LFFLFNCSTKEISMNTTVSMPVASNVAASVVAPTEKQIQRLMNLGVHSIPATRSQASALISQMIASRDMQPATQAQVGRAAVLGGRDLPGAGVREKSTQIAILEAFQLWQQADTDEQHQAALDLVMSRIQERFMKPVAVQQPKGEDAPI
jgi:hypothetical protein